MKFTCIECGKLAIDNETGDVDLELCYRCLQIDESPLLERSAYVGYSDAAP